MLAPPCEVDAVALEGLELPASPDLLSAVLDDVLPRAEWDELEPSASGLESGDEHATTHPVSARKLTAAAHAPGRLRHERGDRDRVRNTSRPVVRVMCPVVACRARFRHGARSSVDRVVAYVAATAGAAAASLRSIRSGGNGMFRQHFIHVSKSFPFAHFAMGFVGRCHCPGTRD